MAGKLEGRWQPPAAWGEFTREVEAAVGYGRLQQPCKVQRTGIAVQPLPHRHISSRFAILSLSRSLHSPPFLRFRRR